MSFELLGFVVGVAAVGCGVLVFLRYEGWKTIRSTYGRDTGRGSGGNALIWPSH